MGEKNEDSQENKEYLKKLGKRIRKLRIKAGYTSHESFAYAHDFPRTQYGRYERGHNITILNLLKIIDAFDITPEEFFCDGFE